MGFMPPTAPNGCYLQELGEGHQEGRELCAYVGTFEKEGRNKNPNLGAVFFRVGCILAAVCTIF